MLRNIIYCMCELILLPFRIADLILTAISATLEWAYDENDRSWFEIFCDRISCGPF